MFSWYGSNYPIFISAQRWVETVKNLKCNDYEFQEKATVFEYIMCLPARREKIRDNVLSFMPVNERALMCPENQGAHIQHISHMRLRTV